MVITTLFCGTSDLLSAVYMSQWIIRLPPQSVSLSGKQSRLMIRKRCVVCLKSPRKHVDLLHCTLGGTPCSHWQFYVDYIMNDILGMICNAHLALADEFGPSHPDCIQLAALASQAVDFSKTGIPVDRDFVRPDAYPDFMGKEVVYILFHHFFDSSSEVSTCRKKWLQFPRATRCWQYDFGLLV